MASAGAGRERRTVRHAGRLGGMAATAVPSSRVGAFVVPVDGDGLRYAVRLGPVLALGDADRAQDTMVMQVPGGRAVRVLAPLE